MEKSHSLIQSFFDVDRNYMQNPVQSCVKLQRCNLHSDRIARKPVLSLQSLCYLVLFVLLFFDRLNAMECSYQVKRANQGSRYGPKELEDSFSVMDPHDDDKSHMTSHDKNEEDYHEKTVGDEYEDDKKTTQDDSIEVPEATEQVDQHDSMRSRDQRSRSHEEHDDVHFGLRSIPSTRSYNKNLSTEASSINKTSGKFSRRPAMLSMTSPNKKKKMTSSSRDYHPVVVIKPPYDHLYSNPPDDRYPIFPAVDESSDQTDNSMMETALPSTSTSTEAPETVSPAVYSSLQTHVRKATRKDKLTSNQDLIHSHQRIVRNRTTASVQIILPKEADFDDYHNTDSTVDGRENEKPDLLQSLRVEGDTSDETPDPRHHHIHRDLHDDEAMSMKRVRDSSSSNSWEIPSASPSMTSHVRLSSPFDTPDQDDDDVNKWFDVRKRNKMTNHKKILLENKKNIPPDFDVVNKRRGNNKRPKVLLTKMKKTKTPATDTHFEVAERDDSSRHPKVRLVLNQTSVITLLKSLTKVTSAKVKRTKDKKYRRVKLQDLIMQNNRHHLGKNVVKKSKSSQQEKEKKWRKKFIGRRLDIDDYVMD